MANNADQPPRDGRRIKDKKQFIEEVRIASHIAEKRSLGYFHHYLVEKVLDICVEIIHYAPLSVSPFVKIHRTSLKYTDMDFNLGIYIILSKGYPMSKKENEEAICRAISRIGEDQYMLTCNNCEHFVTGALTGTSYSFQVDDAMPATLVCAYTLDACCNKNSVTSTLVCIGTAASSTNVLTSKTPETNVNTSIGQSTASTACGQVASSTAKASAKASARKSLDFGTSIVIVNDPAAAEHVIFGGFKRGRITFRKVPNPALVGQKSATSVFKSAAKSTAIAAAIESAFLAKDIYDLRQFRSRGEISETDCKRGIITKTSGTIGSVAGGTAGSIIGQILIPLPIVGGLVGGFVGSFFTRMASSALAGVAFDNA